MGRFGIGLLVDFGSIKWYKPSWAGTVVFYTGCLDVRLIFPQNREPEDQYTEIPKYLNNN